MIEFTSKGHPKLCFFGPDGQNIYPEEIEESCYAFINDAVVNLKG